MEQSLKELRENIEQSFSWFKKLGENKLPEYFKSELVKVLSKILAGNALDGEEWIGIELTRNSLRSELPNKKVIASALDITYYLGIWLNANQNFKLVTQDKVRLAKLLENVNSIVTMSENEVGDFLKSGKKSRSFDFDEL